eukprot:sb/3469374/
MAQHQLGDKTSPISPGEGCLLDEIIARYPDSSEDRVDEMLSMFIAGQETIAHVVTFALGHVARSRDLQEYVKEEVAGFMKEQDGCYEKLSRLPRLNQLMQETLRLYAPVPGLRRVLSHNTGVCGVNIPRGTTIVHCLNMYAHLPELWGPDHDEFRVDRERASYQPFGAGPRTCIGRDVARMEFKILLCYLLHNFIFTPVPGERVEMERVASVKPRSGYHFNVSIKDNNCEE